MATVGFDEGAQLGNLKHAQPIVVDDNPIVGLFGRQGESRWNPSLSIVRGLSELEVVVARLDGVPVELGFDLGAVGCGEVVATAFLLVINVLPMHSFSKLNLIFRFIINETLNGHKLLFRWVLKTLVLHRSMAVGSADVEMISGLLIMDV